ncbi:MAG: hypothetical protein ACT4OO_03225 [Nitrospiraceae bacterium]
MIEVTNLNDEGPGSFRQCAQVESGPRTCVFRVSGTIGLNTYDIEVTNPYLTIDGSTSSGGIALKDGGLWIRASHVIVRHLRVRPGPASLIQRGSNANGISIQSSATGPISDVIIDHASVSWGTDDLMYSIFGSDNVTIQWSILSEALECAQCGGKGLLLDAKNTTVHHSLYAHTYIRWPQMNKGNVDFVNNVKYNGNGTDAQLQPVYGPILANFVGNYFKDGPSAWTQNLGYSEIRAIGNEVYGSSSGIFVQGNIGRYTPAGASMPLWGLATPDRAIIWNDGGGFSVLAQRYPYPQVTTTSAQQAYEDVLNGAGAFPRDSADVRIVNDVRNGTGRWIVDPSDVGGWPVLASGTPPPDTDHDGMPDAWETAHGLNPNDPSDGPQDTNGNGYTNVEEFLHSLHIQAP